MDTLAAMMNRIPVAVNAAAYTGHTSLREDAMGENDVLRPARQDEIEKMKSVLERELKKGSLGLSTGLEYEQAFFSTKDEGRIFLSKLLAECEVARHTDEGDYFSKYGRYHLVLSTNPDAACEVDGEECFMPVGTVWWLENGLPHSFWNRGKTDRIHVIWDAL